MSGQSSFDPIPVGVILPYAGATAPSAYLICDGAAISRTGFSTLFAVLSTTYGTGDGSTTFNLPDLRGRVAAGKAASGTFATLGGTGGEETHVLTTAEMASHAHTVTITDPQHGHVERSVNAGGGASNMPSTTTTGNSSLADSSSTNAASTGITASDSSIGSDTAHQNLQPFQVINYIIKVV